MNLLVRTFLLLTLAGLLSSTAHAMLEGQFLYFPTHEPNRSTLAEWQVDGKLTGYCRTVPTPRSVWLILHGNAGQASDRQYIVDCLPADAAAYIMEYPGYGLRPGKPSMESINNAARHAYENLRALHSPLPVGSLENHWEAVPPPTSVRCPLLPIGSC
jgi:hypothetical protein